MKRLPQDTRVHAAEIVSRNLPLRLRSPRRFYGPTKHARYTAIDDVTPVGEAPGKEESYRGRPFADVVTIGVDSGAVDDPWPAEVFFKRRRRFAEPIVVVFYGVKDG